MSMTKEQYEAKSHSDKKEGFRKWMQEPMTRALLASVPPCDNLEIILEAAFSTGYDRGSGTTSVAFLEAMFEGRRR